MPRAKTKQTGFEYEGQKKKASLRHFGGKTHALEPLHDTYPAILIKPKPSRQKMIGKLSASAKNAKPKGLATKAKKLKPRLEQEIGQDSYIAAQEFAAPRRAEFKQQEHMQPQIPAQVISPDMVQTQEMVEQQRIVREFEHGQITMQRLEEYQGAAGIRPVLANRKKLSRIDEFFKSLTLFVHRLIALISRRNGRQLTMRGKLALSKLEELYALLSAAPDDNMDFVALRVAFGQAYFAVSQASEQHYKRHRGKDAASEDYAAQFEAFLRQLP